MGEGLAWACNRYCFSCKMHTYMFQHVSVGRLCLNKECEHFAGREERDDKKPFPKWCWPKFENMVICTLFGFQSNFGSVL